MKVMLVGNGGELRGKGLGHKIDEHDCIVRCNDFTETLGEDYGRRTHYVAYSKSCLNNAHKLAKKFQIPLDNFWECAYFPYTQYSYDTGILKFSRGCTAILLCKLELGADEIVVVGMEGLMSGQEQNGKAEFYSAKREKTNGGPWRRLTHDWSREKVIVERFCEERGVKLMGVEQLDH